MLERFRAKWIPVRATKTRHGKTTSGGCRAGSAPHENRADDAGSGWGRGQGDGAM
jgi:hypothetical protein